MKKIIFLAGALIVAALSAAVFFTDKPLTEQEKLILRNVEAIAQNENKGPEPCTQESNTSEIWGYCNDGTYGVKEKRIQISCYSAGSTFSKTCWQGTQTQYYHCDDIMYNNTLDGQSNPC